MIKKWLLLNSILIYKNRHPIYDQDGGKMAKIDTLFMTKRLKNPTLSGRTYLYSPYKGVPPGCFYEFNSSMNSIFRKIKLISINSSKYSMNLDLWRIQILVNSHVWILNPNKRHMDVGSVDNSRDLTQQDGWKTQDDRMTKKCCASPGMHSLARHFFVILPSWVFQPSFCVRSLLSQNKKATLQKTRDVKLFRNQKWT